MKILLPIAEGFEEVEAVTSANLLRRAGHEVILGGLDRKPVKAARGTMVIPDASLNDVVASGLGGLIIPGGGPGTERLKGNSSVLDLVKKISGEGKILGAICAGPLVLQAAGILKGKNITSFPTLSLQFGEANWINSPVVIDDRLITSQGPGTAILFGLTLVGIIDGETKREQLAEEIVYRPKISA